MRRSERLNVPIESMYGNAGQAFATSFAKMNLVEDNATYPIATLDYGIISYSLANDRLTFNKDGYYLISSNYNLWDTNTYNTEHRLYKNGSHLTNSGTVYAGNFTGKFVGTLFWIDEFSAGDYVEIYGKSTSTDQDQLNFSFFAIYLGK